MNDKISKWCNVISLVLIVGFIIKTIFDYGKYHIKMNCRWCMSCWTDIKAKKAFMSFIQERI